MGVDFTSVGLQYQKHIVNSDCSCCTRCGFLLEQINISPGTWYAAVDLSNVYSPHLSIRSIRNNLLSSGEARNMPSLSSLTVILPFQPMLQLSTLGSRLPFFLTRYHTGLL